MSSTAAGLNSLASTSCVDVLRRLVWRDGSDHDYVRASKALTIFWGIFSIAFAEFASRLGSLIEAVNKLGSLFYGTILGIFLLAFYPREISGTAASLGALIGEAAVLWCAAFTNLAWLWWNVIGCLVGVGAALVIERLFPAPLPSRVSSEP
jgi:SSS family solute:Na+ symporter